MFVTMMINREALLGDENGTMNRNVIDSRSRKDGIELALGRSQSIVGGDDVGNSTLCVLLQFDNNIHIFTLL